MRSSLLHFIRMLTIVKRMCCFSSKERVIVAPFHARGSMFSFRDCMALGRGVGNKFSDFTCLSDRRDFSDLH